jgi:tRNA(Ile)-lysidine synthase TilS/MesJ
MRRCKLCVLPETFPGAAFNSDGVCSVCAKFKKQREFIPSLEKLKNKLNEIIAENKAKHPKYDALVAFSGGKDSTFLIYTLKEKYDLNILAFTFDNGFLSEHSFANMRSVLETLDTDHLILKPGYSHIKKIFHESANSDIYPMSLLKFGSSICISCIRMVTNLSLKTAIEKKIPMVMLGNSPGQLIQSENEIIFKDNRIPYELKKRLFKPLAERTGDDTYYYLMLNKEEYRTKPFPYIINPFPLIGYDEERIYQTIKALGWKKPVNVDPNSTNCRLNSLGIIKHKEKYNFHPYDYEMSMLVRLGVISRHEALNRLEDPGGKAVKLAEQVEKELRENSDANQ